MTWTILRNSLLLLLAALLLVGCAGEQAFREGKALVSAGKMDEGLLRLEQAVKENPEAVEYRNYLLIQRDKFANQILAQADTDLINSRFDEADATYRRVLGMDRANPRANIGIEAVQAARRHKAMVEEAEVAFSKGQVEVAQNKLRKVLSDNPRHREGKALLRRIEDKKVQVQTSSIKLKSSIEQPITLEFRDASLQSVFEAIFRAAGINFIFDKDVKAD